MPKIREVFARSHELIRKLAAEDVVHGVRVDHVDGLLDPLGYLRQLRTELEDGIAGAAVARRRKGARSVGTARRRLAR